MKEYNYDSILCEDIEKSKKKNISFKEYFSTLVLCSGTALAGLGISRIPELGLITTLSFAGAFVATTATVALISNNKNNQKKKKAKENLTTLQNHLKGEDISLSISDLQRSIVTKDKRKVKEVNRKGEVTNVEEIIKRYYMLDEEKQLQVLQQTISKCKTGSAITNNMSLQLLEKEDLKNVELPEIIVRKSLKFNDSKK